MPEPLAAEFRLRRFIQSLAQQGELETIDAPIDLIDVAARLDGNPKAVLLRQAGAAKAELVGNVMGSRRRLALAFDVDERDLLPELLKRAAAPLAPVEVASAAAPVHEIVLTGAEADFTRLPVHLQHAEDGAPYISAGIDISRNLAGTKRNVGYRRLMLRGRHEAGIDLVAPSDLRAIYGEYVKRGERMPIAFVIGSHPADSVAAAATWSTTDEVGVMGALRGAPVPLVKCATIDAYVPADAEIVLEGHVDERGWTEPEGPYGEFLGYYGHMKMNPVFHLTAITMRRDALFQTVTISGRHLEMTETAQLNALRTEAAVWNALLTAVREPVAVYAPPSSSGVYNLRLSLRQRFPGEARNAIAAALGSVAEVKHVFVVDEDVDVFSDAQMEWALATRFQADRDLVIGSGFRAVPLDPSLRGSRTGAKAGFDLTLPRGEGEHVPEPPQQAAAPRHSVLQALQQGPRSFLELMNATGSRDGHDVLLALDAIRRDQGLERAPDGRYQLGRAMRPA